MAAKCIRRHRRVPHLGSVRISWEGSHGHVRYAHAKCRDISQGGLRIVAPEPIPLHTTVWLQAERIKFTGSATVKHVMREGAKYVLGLELSQAIRAEAVEDAGESGLVGVIEKSR